MITQKIGRYQVDSVLGRGAMGTVYKAVDPLIERTVAIKTISLDLSKEERAEFEERFYREAKSAGRLSHPNIVTIYDVGEVDDVAYIAMEYLEGKSLREMLDSGVVLPVDQISRIAARIASALNYAHENRVVHRDIKPANIMILRNRDIKIMDFGIAHIPTGSRTQVGTVLGSPKYMAPEQVQGKTVDGRTDVFALGVLLFEMLTGTTPFNGDNLSAIMYKIINEEPIAPSKLNARVPPVFDRIVTKALAKQPEDRYQTARAFARDLRNYEAFIPQESSHPAAMGGATQAARKTEATPAQAAKTLDLHEAEKTAFMPLAGSGGENFEQTSVLPASNSPQRKMLLLAIPVLGVAALAIFFFDRQTPQPSDGPAAIVKNVEKSTPTLLAPTVPATILVEKPQTTVSEPPAVAAPAKATLAFAVSPWGEVFVDGKKMGVSPPLTTLRLAPGSRRIEIRNEAFAPYRGTVSLTTGQTLKIKHKFK